MTTCYYYFYYCYTHTTLQVLSVLLLGVGAALKNVLSYRFRAVGINVAPDLMEGFGLMKSFRGIIQNQLLFEGFGIMKSFWDRK